MCRQRVHARAQGRRNPGMRSRTDKRRYLHHAQSQARNSRKSLPDGLMQILRLPHFIDGLERCRQIAPIMRQHRRAHAYLGMAQRGLGIGTEVVIEKQRL